MPLQRLDGPQVQIEVPHAALYEPGVVALLCDTLRHRLSELNALHAPDDARAIVAPFNWDGVARSLRAFNLIVTASDSRA
jgi:hypothetical protein